MPKISAIKAHVPRLQEVLPFRHGCVVAIPIISEISPRTSNVPAHPRRLRARCSWFLGILIRRFTVFSNLNYEAGNRGTQGVYCGLAHRMFPPWIPMETVVEARNLTKAYGSFVAVKGIDFTVLRQECFGFLGPNGAGKTSTMKMIYCRTPVTSGSLSVLGMDVSRHEREVKSRIGVVTQENDLDPDLTVIDNLTLYASFFGVSWKAATAKADDLLDFVQLRDKRSQSVKELSGGMKRRLTIARALVNEPELLILDEPTTALDPQARLLVWQKLGELKSRGVTLMITTHYMEEAARLCDRLLIMHEGKILAEGSPRELIAGHVADYVVEVPAEGRHIDALLHALGERVRFMETVGDTLFIYSEDGVGARNAVAEAGVLPGSAVTREATLEDVFLRLTGRDLDE
jgi:lipooligosaccharide transport system ATP-binding protein